MSNQNWWDSIRATTNTLQSLCVLIASILLSNQKIVVDVENKYASLAKKNKIQASDSATRVKSHLETVPISKVQAKRSRVYSTMQPSLAYMSVEGKKCLWIELKNIYKNARRG